LSAACTTCRTVTPSSRGNPIDALRDSIERRDFDTIGLSLRLLYVNELSPKSEEKKLSCIDCQRLLDPEKRQSVSEEEISDLLRALEDEQKWVMGGYELELDKRTVTGSTSIAYLAPHQQDQWMCLRVERLREAVDRMQRVITRLLKTSALARRYGSDAPAGEGAGVKDAYGRNAKRTRSEPENEPEPVVGLQFSVISFQFRP